MNDTDPHSYGALCRDCRVALGAQPMSYGMAVTAHAGDCVRCKAKNVTLIPTRDYRWPQHQKGKRGKS